jgi:hypothetical protein
MRKGKPAKPPGRVTVTVECVGCGGRREIGPGEVPPGEVPHCEKDYLPMVAVAATARLPRDPR